VSDAFYYEGHRDEMRAYIDKALSIFDKSRDESGAGRAYYSLAYYYERDEPERMLSLLERARPYADRAADPPPAMNIENGVGTACWNLARFRAAIEHFTAAAALAERRGDGHSLAVARQNVGLMHEYRAEFGEAISYYGRALAYFEPAGDRPGTAIVLGNLG